MALNKNLVLRRSSSPLDYASQPAASGTRRPKAHNREVLILQLGEHPGIFTALARVCSERQENPFSGREELSGEASLSARLCGLRLEHRGTP